MKFNTLKYSIYVLIVIFVCISCNDDDDDEFVLVPERDRAEQQLADNDSIVNYLSTHYYNSDFFQTGVDHKYTDIIITELEEGENVPAGHTLLFEDVETFTTEYVETDYEYYILRLNQGGGDAPKFTDFLRVRYEGTSVNTDEVFDMTVTPVDLLLQRDAFRSGTIKAWQLVFPEFNASENFGFNNGAVDFTNFGLGVMFVPSGLAYFEGSNTGSSYDNLIFKFELFQFKTEDHDNDGIPSYVEDLNGNLIVEDDDTDNNTIPNFIDINDDGDEVLTINELIPTIYSVNTNIGEEEPVLAVNEYERSRSENAGVITINTVTIADDNEDGVPDYLDEAITINYNED
jgi:FKBP-type peptidyl-prolyl cis-trans isomerase FkpA